VVIYYLIMLFGKLTTVLIFFIIMFAFSDDVTSLPGKFFVNYIVLKILR